MKLASYVLASYNRPVLMPEVVKWLQRSEVPAGWDLEIVVCTPLDQRQDLDGVVWTSSHESDIGSQLTGAFRASRGELVLVTGDDDFQAPQRLRHAVEAYEAGHAMSGIRRFQFWNRRDGRYCRWDGDVRRAGGLRSYSRQVLERCHGWHPGNHNVDHHLDLRMSANGIPLDVVALPAAVGAETVGTDGSDNVCRGRPFPKVGESVKAGAYCITGLSADEFATLPKDLRDALSRCME